MKYRKPLKWIALPLVLLLVAAAPFTEKYFKVIKNLEIFVSLYKEVNEYYVDDVNPNILMQTGVDAMLASLDPYTNYISEDRIEDYRIESSGEYGGIGALTTNLDGVTRVVMLYKENAAYKAGLKIGDRILKVNNIAIKGKDADAINKLVKGEAGSSVQLTIKRTGKDSPMKVSIKRETVKVKNVPYFGMLKDNKTGYVKLSNFTPKAGNEVKEAVIALKEAGATQIILDVRDNPGGLLIESVNICNIFLEKGQEVVSTKGKVSSNNITYETQKQPVDIDIPLAVVQSNGSASASEIVAGTLQDYDRAVIIGQNSYGKGLVQVPRPLSYKAQLKVTIAKYYIPSGRCIQALDYSHRNTDGSVGTVPDSLKQTFYTANRRPVLDGGGVAPDVATEPTKKSDVAFALELQSLIFDFATQYYYQNQENIPEAEEFSLSPEEYQSFVQFVKRNNFDYDSEAEIKLDTLKSVAKREGEFKNLETEFKKLEQKIEQGKKTSLITHQKEITTLLEREIIAHYHLEEGYYQSNLKNDATINKAISVLENTEAYYKILSGAQK